MIGRHEPRRLSRHPAEIHWYEVAGIGRKEIKISTCFKGAMPKTVAKQFVVCVNNEGYEASLEERKIYLALPDAAGAMHGPLRVIDESGESYLYPKAFFRTIALPQSIRRAVFAAA